MEQDEYRRMAALEDGMWYYRTLHSHLQRELAARLGDRAATVLDAGCGTGGLIRRLSKSNPAWQWTGVDVSPLACQLARSRTGADIREASLTGLPFEDATFDAVVTADVLYHIEDDALALAELARVLRRGGLIVVNVPAHRWLWSYHDVATHAKRRYSRGELGAKLAAVGIAGLSITHWNTLLLPLVAVRRKLLPAPRVGSDVHAYPVGADAAFGAIAGIERGWLATGAKLPFGTSILAAGTRL
jgi:SAM-dependent methyltransferase